jgi:hypothetical protein
VISARPEVLAFDNRLDNAALHGVALAIIWDLDVESFALRARDFELLRAVDHGARLHELRRAIDDAAGDVILATTYEFDTFEFEVVRRGGQSGSVLSIRARGQAVRTRVDAGGDETPAGREPAALEIGVRRADGARWLIVDVRPLD